MAMPDEIADVLEEQLESFGVVGTSIFTHQMPPTPDSAISVHQFRGQPPATTMTRTVAEYPGLQVQCRATSKEEAEATCYAVWTLLNAVTNTDIDGERINGVALGSTWYLGIRAKASPQQLRIDQQGRTVWYVEFDVTKEPS